nr:hypothetical protein CFP56_15934 [Quercus suber]
MADHSEDYARYLQNVDQLAPLQVDSGSETEEEEDDDDDEEEEEEEDQQCKRRRTDGNHYIWRTTDLEHLLGDVQSRASRLANAGGQYQGRTVFGHSSLMSALELCSHCFRYPFPYCQVSNLFVPTESCKHMAQLFVDNDLLAVSYYSDDIVASYYPKVEMQNEMAISQPSITHSQVIGQGVQGSDVHYKEVGSNCFQKLGSACANVNESRIPIRSAILDIENQGQMFASGDEVMRELILQELPSLTVLQHLNTQKRPIRDVKYTHAISQGLLSCLSEDTLHLFGTNSHEKGSELVKRSIAIQIYNRILKRLGNGKKHNHFMMVLVWLRKFKVEAYCSILTVLSVERSTSGRGSSGDRRVGIGQVEIGAWVSYGGFLALEISEWA